MAYKILLERREKGGGKDQGGSTAATAEGATASRERIGISRSVSVGTGGARGASRNPTQWRSESDAVRGPGGVDGQREGEGCGRLGSTVWFCGQLGFAVARGDRPAAASSVPTAVVSRNKPPSSSFFFLLVFASGFVFAGKMR
ncbi:hypothetical protein RJT34_23511 [Clitoria ternatea]|uniref:Uncharacterized protein n=1 Tax=Clitoria ternatea TaxID=43366 RepID=A0AAN9FP06_CLITE